MRPKSISTVCVIGFILVVFSFPQVFSPAIKKLGMLIPAVYGAIIAFQFISFVGLWHFKQWGAIGFTMVFFCKIYFNIMINETGILFYIYIAICLFSFFFVFKHFRQMSPDFQNFSFFTSVFLDKSSKNGSNQQNSFVLIRIFCITL